MTRSSQDGAQHGSGRFVVVDDEYSRHIYHRVRVC